VKDGGLGVRRVSSLAFSAFIASVAATRHTPATAVISQLDRWDH